MEVKRLVAQYDSMQVTLRSRRRAATGVNCDRQRPFTSDLPCHSSSSPARASSSTSSSSSTSLATTGVTRNYQLRRANSSNLHYYPGDTSPVVRSPNTRRRSVNQLISSQLNSVTIRRASSTNDEPNMSSLRIGTNNFRNESEITNCLPPSRPSSTPIYSTMSSGSNHHRNRRRRQLPQCPDA